MAASEGGCEEDQSAASPIARFDVRGLFEALDQERARRGLSWRQAADEMWQQSWALNRRRQDHPISPSTITGMTKRDNTTCQHALVMLRWLGRTPESFLIGAASCSGDAALPAAGPDRRLRWNLSALYEALNARRGEQGLTWPELAGRLRCSPNQLTGIRTARYAINMRLAMRIVQWLERPAADFIYAAKW